MHKYGQTELLVHLPNACEHIFEQFFVHFCMHLQYAQFPWKAEEKDEVSNLEVELQFGNIGETIDNVG